MPWAVHAVIVGTIFYNKKFGTRTFIHCFSQNNVSMKPSYRNMRITIVLLRNRSSFCEREGSNPTRGLNACWCIPHVLELKVLGHVDTLTTVYFSDSVPKMAKYRTDHRNMNVTQQYIQHLRFYRLLQNTQTPIAPVSSYPKPLTINITV